MPSILPFRSRRSPPPALHERAADNLRFIRETMERAASFTAVSGWGQVAIGLTALAATPLGMAQGSPAAWLGVWLAEAAVAIAISSETMRRKSRRRGLPLLSRPGRKFAMSFLPAAAAGALLSAVLVRAGQWDLLPGTWLLLYGAGVTTAGSHSVRLVPAMGMAFMGVGALALLGPAAWGNACMALGFGCLHLGFGVGIARRHGG